MVNITVFEGSIVICSMVSLADSRSHAFKGGLSNLKTSKIRL